MLKNLNLPLHGILLDSPLEKSYDPLINCDSYFTFDDTSPFLAFSSFATFINEYQLTISLKTTSLFTYNFQMEGLKHMYPICFKEYPMKMHFSTFESSFGFLSSKTCIYARQQTL